MMKSPIKWQRLCRSNKQLQPAVWHRGVSAPRLLRIIPHRARAGRALESFNHLKRLFRSLPCFPAFGEQKELPFLPSFPALLLCANGWAAQLQELYK